MESYPEHVKRSQKEFSSMHKTAKQILQHMGVIVNRFMDFSETLAAIAKHEPSFMREPLAAMSSVVKAFAAEISTAVKGIITLPNCFDMKDDNSRILESIKNQTQAQAPFYIQTNHEFIINSAVFERTRAANLQRALYNLGHALLYIGARSVESGTNLKTLSALINPHASVLDTATRFRDLDLGENVTMSMLLQITPEEVRDYSAPRFTEKIVRYAGQFNTYKVKRRPKGPSVMPPKHTISDAENNEFGYDATRILSAGYQNVTLTSPPLESNPSAPPKRAVSSYTPVQGPRTVSAPTAAVAPVVSATDSFAQQQSKQIQDYQQQILRQQEEISLLQGQLKEQLQINIQRASLHTSVSHPMESHPLQQCSATKPVPQHQQEEPINSTKPASTENAIQMQKETIAQPKHYSEDLISTSDDTTAAQFLVEAQPQKTNPFMKPKHQTVITLNNELSNFVQESDLLDTPTTRARESTEVSQISMSKRMSNVLNPMTRSTTEIDVMGDDYDLSQMTAGPTTAAPTEIRQPNQQNPIETTNMGTKAENTKNPILDFDSSLDEFEGKSHPRVQQEQKKKSALSDFLRDPSAKNRTKSALKPAAGLYGDDSFNFTDGLSTKPSQTIKPKIDINALDDDDEVDFFI